MQCMLNSSTYIHMVNYFLKTSFLMNQKRLIVDSYVVYMLIYHSK